MPMAIGLIGWRRPRPSVREVVLINLFSSENASFGKFHLSELRIRDDLLCERTTDAVRLRASILLILSFKAVLDRQNGLSHRCVMRLLGGIVFTCSSLFKDVLKFCLQCLAAYPMLFINK